MKIFLVRHAEVQKEYLGCYNGHIDISLSEDGKASAKELADSLKDIKFDKIFCSDLKRARETLDAFELKEDVIFTTRLREKSWGKDEGKSFSEIEREGIKYINFEQWIDALDGEDMQTYIKNAVDYFNETILKTDAKNILVVTHAGFIRAILSHQKKITLEETFKIKVPYGSYIKVI